MENVYLNRYAWPGPILSSIPKANTHIIVVIPCYNEPSILDTLNSLYNCEIPDCHVELIIVVNYGIHESNDIKSYHRKTVKSIEVWINSHQKEGLSFFIISAFDLPQKHAGVGLARKIGMDEAVRRFERLNDSKGIIACFDADCTCKPNYLQEIFLAYEKHKETNVALVYFEHPLKGNLNPLVYEGIINYELHLRYFKNALRIVNFPFSYHTIGSCITVTSEAYQKQNGMNRRKAGEDFYFLQKLFPLGHIENINTTTIYPSPRPSNRVPFGTGKAINDYLKNSSKNYFTYNPRIFIDLANFLKNVTGLYEKKSSDSIIKQMPTSVQSFLSEIQFQDNIIRIKDNCSSSQPFLKSFFQWFNGFMVLKYVHYARDNFYEGMEILDAVNWLLHDLAYCKTPITTKRKALELLRKLDKSQ